MLEPIGVVKSNFTDPTDWEEMRKYISEIVVKPEFKDGLYKIERNEHLQIIFQFHLSEGYKLKAPRRRGKVRGVFASRSPKRPNPIGLTTVELIEKEGRILTVKGLDALDGSPVLDIKPHSPLLDEPQKR